MNENNVEVHTMKAMVVEEVAKYIYVPEIDTTSMVQSSPKPEGVPMDSALMALANNPELVEGHLQKWRGLSK